MLKQRQKNQKGKIRLSQYFQELNKGDKVAVVKNLSVASSFPDRIQGRTGIIDEKRGRSYVVKLKIGSTTKKFIIAPIHLKKLKN